MSGALFEDAPAAQWIVQSGKLTHANAKARATFGWPEDLAGTAPPSAPDADEAAWLADPDERPRSLQLGTADHQMRFSVSAAQTERGTYFSAHLLDEYRVLDRSFFADQSAVSQLLDALPIGVYVMTAQGVGFYANERAYQLLGRGLVQSTDDLTVHAPVRLATGEPYPVEELPIVRALNGESCDVDDLGIVRPEGTMPLDVWAAPVHGAEGQIEYAIAVFSDATERRAAEAERDRLQAQLIDASRAAGMAEIATSVLHDVGNVLNSVKVSTTQLQRMVERSSARHLSKTVALIEQHADDLGAFLTADPRGQRIPAFLRKLADAMDAEQTGIEDELVQLAARTQHMQTVVAAQQSAATRRDLRQRVDLVELLQGAMAVHQHLLEKFSVKLEWDAPRPVVVETDRHKVMQALLNLISNACDALGEVDDRRLRLSCRAIGDRAVIQVADTGRGVPAEVTDRIFQSGFTTKAEGHGFGLHSSANVIREVGGDLNLLDGGSGATFEIRLPLG